MIKNKLFGFCVLMLLVVSSSRVFAQFSLKIEGVVKENGKGVGGALVSLVTDETGAKKETTTSSGGGFSFSLKANEEYSIYVEKAGYMKPKVMYSTMGFSEEDAKKFKGTSNPEIEIFKLPEDADLTSKINETFERPLMSYVYNSDKGVVAADDEANADMNAEFLKMQKMADDFRTNNIPVETKYNNAIAKADKALNLKDYEAAKTNYSDALKFKPNEPYPTTKIADIDRIVAMAADAERLAKEKAAADAAEKERLAKLKANADAADKERIAKEKADAAIAAEKARLAKEAEMADAATKARLEKEKADAALAEKQRLEKEKLDAAAAERDRLAKEKADAAEKVRLAKEAELADAATRARLEKEKADAALAEKQRLEKERLDVAAAERDRLAKEKADAAEKVRLAKEAELAEAKEKSRLEKEKVDAALAEKQQLEKERLDAAAAERDRLAKEKAIADAARMAQEARDKAVADSTEKIRLEKEAVAKAINDKYNGYINRGDSAISEQNYDLARINFREALKVKDENYPKTRMADIETMILNDQAFKNDLAKKYPVGMTEEKTKESNMNVTRRIVVIGNKGVLYEKKETAFGAVYYFKDGVPITEKEYTKGTDIKK